MNWITEKIDPIEDSRDVEYIADVLSEILYNKHGRRIDALAFDMEVTFKFYDDDEEEQHDSIP